ncbi:MAG: hypothetical protein ISS15_09855 [Alphaproteobacteria bacterium]|nr:hypothetical protein [Alphaproteobacteria bacterium]MBL7097952.1 hypothetical protein [Alphaproteobacteria bacterium]
MPSETAPSPSSATPDVTRAYRRRGWAIAAVFVAVELAIVAASLVEPGPLSVSIMSLLGLLTCGLGFAMARRMLERGLKAEADSFANQARISDFAELASDWFCELDRDLVVTYVSRHHSEATPNILVGQRWSPGTGLPGFSPPDRSLADAALDHLPFRDLPMRENEPGGQVNHWSLSGKPQFAADGSFAGYRVSARNITPVIEALQQLARARDEAERANRAKSAFLANMSHELRTPLNAILGFSELIGMQVAAGKGDLRHGSYAHDIQTSGRHLLAIINDLLEHSRVEAGEMSLTIAPFDVAEAIESVRTLCQPRADALDVVLRTEVPDGLPQLRGDALRFKQVLINIVTNAIKFSPEGEVTVSAHPDGAMLRVEVLDNGIGMDAAGLEQALKPFGQADSGLNRKYEGTGLGVPLAKALTELQGGRFAIASKPGAGTRVTITMPLMREAVEPVAVAAA